MSELASEPSTQREPASEPSTQRELASEPSTQREPATQDVPPVHEAARRWAEHLTVDETRDVVYWRDDTGRQVETGFHDYAALYQVPGLYEAAYFLRLGGRAPHMLAEVLAQVVPRCERPNLQVLDVGAGTGVVGERLAAVGFRRIAGTDLEPAGARAVLRDRGHIYGRFRTMDLARPSDDDLTWMRTLAPHIAAVAGAVGFGHLPVDALAIVTRALPPGGLLAVTVAHGFEEEPALKGYVALLLGPAYRQRARREGLHRRTADGARLEVTALVLERSEVQ
ncbi:MAG: hypothetical protein ACRDRK_27950 [Pseudonocardia sp.]